MPTQQESNGTPRWYVAARRSAFSILEILLVVVVIGIIASLVGPRLVRKDLKAEWSFINDELNSLLLFARQEAIARQKIHRLALQTLPDGRATITVEREEDDEQKPGAKKFVFARSEYFTPRYELPDAVKLVAVMQGRTNMLEENKNKAYCHVVPTGKTQDVTLKIQRTQHDTSEVASFHALPFLGYFEQKKGDTKQ